MKRKLHPRTQKAVNDYARRKLALYRSSRIGGSTPEYSRFAAGFLLCDKLHGNVYAVVKSRELHYHLATKKAQG